MLFLLVIMYLFAPVVLVMSGVFYTFAPSEDTEVDGWCRRRGII